MIRWLLICLFVGFMLAWAPLYLAFGCLYMMWRQRR